MLSSPMIRRITLCVLALLAVGQLMLFSATAVSASQRYNSEFYYVLRQTLGALLGLFLMWVLSRAPYQRLQRYAFAFMLIQLGLMVITLLTPLGFSASGGRRWLRLAGFAFQPSELAKITVAVYAAFILSRLAHATSNWRPFAKPLALVALLLGLVFKQPDLGSTLVLAAILWGLVFVSGFRLRYVLGGALAGATFAVIAMLTSDYRRRRLMAFLNPWSDPRGSGFQTIQSFLSFHSGKVFGVGIGNGNSKLFFLPEIHTDFIFSLIGEELGFLGALLVVGLFVYLIYLCFKVAVKAPDLFGTYLAYAIGLSLALQVAMNMGGVTGLVPLKGLPLPFISWGRSALIVQLAMMGILLNIARQSGILAREPSKS